MDVSVCLLGNVACWCMISSSSSSSSSSGHSRPHFLTGCSCVRCCAAGCPWTAWIPWAGSSSSHHQQPLGCGQSGCSISRLQVQVSLLGALHRLLGISLQIVLPWACPV
jgi:hypothetical protein